MANEDKRILFYLTLSVGKNYCRGRGFCVPDEACGMSFLAVLFWQNLEIRKTPNIPTQRVGA